MVKGESALSEQELRRSIHRVAGAPLSPSKIKTDAAAVAEQLTKLGYLQASVSDSIAIDTVHKNAKVLFTINQGPLCYSGTLGIVGLKKVRPRVVKRELRFAPGDTLTSGKIRASIKGLYDLGLFNFVQIAPLMTDSAPHNNALTAPVMVALDEAKFFTIDASAGYGTYERFRAALETAYSNCFGLGHTMSLDGTANRFSQRAELGYAIPWIFSLPLRTEASAYIERHDITYRGLFEGVGLSLIPRTADRFSLRLWGRYEKTVYIETFRDTVIEPKNTQSIGVDFTYDLRQSLTGRSVGMLFRCSPELAGLIGKNSNQFYRALIDLRCYVDPLHALKLSAAISAGYAREYGAAGGIVPPQARYYIGSEGLRPIRGYATDTIGGTFSLVINCFEADILIYKWIGLTLFADGGHAWENFELAASKDMRWVAGPGLFVKLAFGEIRLDFPYKLNGEKGWGALFLSIGSAF
jgi:outer membrane protein insertion porin family